MNINMHLVDELVLKIFLKGEPRSLIDKGGRNCLVSTGLGERYWYLELLTIHADEEFDLREPLQGIEKGLFLDRLIKKNPNLYEYSPAMHHFVFNSLCSIFHKNPEELLNRKKY